MLPGLCYVGFSASKDPKQRSYPEGKPKHSEGRYVLRSFDTSFADKKITPLTRLSIVSDRREQFQTVLKMLTNRKVEEVLRNIRRWSRGVHSYHGGRNNMGIEKVSRLRHRLTTFTTSSTT